MFYGFVQQSRDPKVDELMKVSPPAFMLATQIARRARRDDRGLNPHKLKIGEAEVGDFRSIGLTEQQYRTAKRLLEKMGLATFRATNRGSIASLTDSSIYNLNTSKGNGQPTGKVTGKVTGQPTGQSTDREQGLNPLESALSEAENSGSNGQDNGQGNRTATDKVTTKNKGEEGVINILPSGDGGEGDSRFKAVTDGYCQSFLAVFGEAYVHTGGRDGNALKKLLSRLDDSFTAERIVKSAKAAMIRTQSPYATACKQARTIQGFCGAYNEIRAELIAEKSDGNTRQKSTGGSNARGAIDRNRGTANAGDTSDYSSVGKVADGNDGVQDAEGPPTCGDADGGGDVPA